MLVYVSLALLNGLVIGTSRALNGQLSTQNGPFKASFWNHAVGALFLIPALFAAGEWQLDAASAAPPVAYLGGVIGALFVAINSYVFYRLGAMDSALLVISGQMISAVLLDTLNQGVAPSVTRCLGVAVVLVGISLRYLSGKRRNRSSAR
jgi:bacterial/archaeal transporter family-2 protein